MAHTGRGLPPGYLKKYGMAEGWKVYKAEQNSSGHHARRASGETVVPTPDGSGVTSRSARGLHAFIGAHGVVEYDQEAIGQFLWGFFQAMRAPRGADLSTMFPPPDSQIDEARWRRGAQEREFGREVYQHMGKGLVYFKVTEQEWQAGYARARAASGGQESAAQGSSAGYRFPLESATVTVPQGMFGSVRPDGRIHRGVDLAVPVGTEVMAPGDARVEAVFNDDEGGLAVRLAMKRPDGGYANNTTLGDDSGFLITFAHLSQALVEPGDAVTEGQVVALSGNSGRHTSGPHVHVMAEYLDDASVLSWSNNSRTIVDPTALWDANLQAGAPIAAEIEPRVNDMGPFGGAPTPSIGSIVIGGDGAIQIGNGAAVNVKAKPVFNLTPYSGGSGDLGLGAGPTPDALRGAFPRGASSPAFLGARPQVNDVAGQVVQGLGVLHGTLWRVVEDPRTQQLAVGLAATGAAVAAAALPVIGQVAASMVGVFGAVAGGFATAFGTAFATAAAPAVLSALGIGTAATVPVAAASAGASGIAAPVLLAL